MSKKNKKLMCAVYLSVDAPDKEIQDKEEKQFRYIKDYCKGNGLKIVKLYHRAGLSRCEMQKHFVELARQIEVGELQAVVIANSRYISCGVYVLYMKVGRIAAAGGKVYSLRIENRHASHQRNGNDFQVFRVPRSMRRRSGEL